MDIKINMIKIYVNIDTVKNQNLIIQHFINPRDVNMFVNGVIFMDGFHASRNKRPDHC